MRVVAAVIERDGRWLLGKRPAHKRHGGLWEFPGGKVVPGESALEAARRELAEELSLRVVGTGRTLYSARDGASPFLIDFVEVVAEGEPVAHEHDEIGWLTPAEAARLPLAPTDRAFVEAAGGGGAGGPTG